jgi:hypothetical protein
MMKTPRLILLAGMAFTLMACTVSVNVPKVQTGIINKMVINESSSADANPVELTIEMGAGSLEIKPGATSAVEGTIAYNVEDWKPRVSNTGSRISISQTNTKNVGIPDGQIENAWNLKIGSMPIDLSISTGANEGSFDLGGLSIKRLSISDGASKTTVTFNDPNLVELEKLEYHTGASEVNLLGLGNANVREIEFNGGAGSYELDFSGDLSNDINVRIGTGMSDLSIIIPSGAHAIININGGLSNINAAGTWTINGGTYESGSTGPTIRITIDMAVGNLNLVQK